MGVEVLTKLSDNTIARGELRRRGISFASPWFSKLLHKTGIVKHVQIGDESKSWDVLRTVQFIEQHVQKCEPILDLGAYASEVLHALRRLGYSDLTGVDLNPELLTMPGSPDIRYVTGDFTSTSFPDASFGAITAISVIEHGFTADRIFSEISRLLKSGGYFIGSTDYWPEKIDTSGIKVFGMDWSIFSKKDLLTAIDQAGNYGLRPVGALNLEAADRTARWMQRKYTFAWFAFRKV